MISALLCQKSINTKSNDINILDYLELPVKFSILLLFTIHSFLLFLLFILIIILIFFKLFICPYLSCLFIKIFKN